MSYEAPAKEISRQELGHIVENDFRDNFLSTRVFEQEFQAVYKASEHCNHKCKVDCWIILKNKSLLGLQITIAKNREKQKEKINEFARQPIVCEHDRNGKAIGSNVPKALIFVEKENPSEWKKDDVLKNIKESLIIGEGMVGSNKDRQLLKDYREYFGK